MEDCVTVESFFVLSVFSGLIRGQSALANAVLYAYDFFREPKFCGLVQARSLAGYQLPFLDGVGIHGG